MSTTPLQVASSGTEDFAQHMPITYQLDRPNRLVRAEVVGDFTVSDMLDCISSAVAEAAEPGFNVLSDHRRIGEPATRDQIEKMVARLVGLRMFLGGSRWAVVVASAASYGMMRMLGTLVEGIPMQVRAFHSMEDAEAWLREPSDLQPATVS